MTGPTSQSAESPTVGRELRRQLVIFASLLLVVVAGTAALFLANSVDSQMTDVQASYETRREVGNLIQSLTDAETGQRGFLLTLDQAYLDPYRAAVASIDSTFSRLAELVARDASQKLRLEEVSAHIEQKRSEMAITIRMAMEDRVGEALAMLRSNTGRSLMTGIRAALSDFVAHEDASLVERNADVASLRSWLIAMIVVALAGAGVLTYALLAQTQRAVQQLSRRASDLRSLASELESRVQERTAELEESRTHAERERARVEALLRDTNHRIGNSLATVSSLLGLQVTRTRSDEVRSALEAAQNRVQAIASAHRRLRLGDDLETTRLDEFIGAAAEDLQSTQLAGRKVTLAVEVEPLVVRARDATTIGIIVGELVINAIKHAFAEDGAGRIDLTLARGPEGGATLAVSDDGRGLSHDTKDERGLGAMIISQLARQFGGTPRYETGPAGGTRVVVPLPDLEVTTPGGDT
jgi:two-component sensor histidine kinase